MGAKIFMQKSGSGFTLIETLVGIALLVGVLVGPVTFLSTSFTRAGPSEDRLTSLYLAQEGVELVRAIRDNNVLAELAWNNGLSDGTYEIDYNSGLTAYSNPGTKLLFDTATGIYSYDSGVNSKFVRRVTISNLSGTQMRVTSTVEWNDRFGTRSVQLQEVLYNWL